MSEAATEIEGLRKCFGAQAALALTVMVLFMLGIGGKLPRSIDIFRGIGATSSLVVQQIPWVAIATACVLALLFFAAALIIIRRRDY
ncbi:MAG TPA: hypothetical protein VN735_12315 [Steroidobacteraceae bacterium]|nr:hypothetical protein [Steroidobacteraceae bacterium]